MGAYLSHPITKTEPEDGAGNSLEYGASSMQGWRVSQEDAHNCVPDFDESSSFFAVYDGHGGSEVAVYLSRRLPEFLKATDSYKHGNYQEALSEAYLKIDESIRTPEVLKEIVRLSKFGKSAIDVDGNDEEDVNELYEEATMPIELLVAKYKDGLLQKLNNKLKEVSGEKPGSSKSFRKAGGSSEGVSSSASSSKTVSASSSFDDDGEAEPCSSSSSQITPSVPEPKKDDTPEEVSSSSISNGKNSTAEIQVDDIEPDSATLATDSILVNGKEDAKDDEAVVSSNGILVIEDRNVIPTVSEKASDAESTVREESILEPTKKKGKVHPPLVAHLPPKPSPEKRTSPRKNTEKVYMDFLTGESTSEESEDDPDSAEFTRKTGSDSDNDSEEAEGNSSSEVDDDEEEEDDEEDEDAVCEEEDAQEDEDDEMLKDCQEPGYDSGATAVTAFSRWDGNKLHLWVANAGDSRCIVSRHGMALEMSEDHKPEDEREAFRIVNAGGKVTAEGRVNGGLNLSRAIGDHSYKTNPTLSLHEQMITSLPDVKYAELNPESDNFIVLACDGIWNSMTSQQVIDFVAERISKPDTKLSQICEELFHACLAEDTGGDGTGCDNMTAIIVKINSHPSTAADLDSEPISTYRCIETSEINSTVAESEMEESKISALKRTFNGSPGTSEESEEKRLKLDSEEKPV